MTIAFIVVAAVAFIFLLVFNTKVSRKSSKASPSDEDSRQRSKRPYPVKAKTEARALPDDTEETRHKTVEVHHDEPSADTNTKLVKDSQKDIRTDKTFSDGSITTRDSYGDQDYREALRGFAGKGEEKEGRPKTNNGESEAHRSEDEQYREALRSMNRKK
jgi:cytoskeletal protein RodZ